MRLYLPILLAFAIRAVGQTTAPAGDPLASKAPNGHSAHGSAFDSGPRQKPWIMSGIGNAPFPITAKNPEVQTWFNQGNALLHSFDYYDAERAFRWCVKLEPENAMAYWGLAVATEARDPSGPNRAADFLREAVKRKANVTERERLYIEAWEAVLLPDPVRPAAAHSGNPWRNPERIKRLETLCVKYPDDVEARAYLALMTMGESRYATELVIREILSRAPLHPGAHHYRIHNWDYHEPEQALESCRIYTEQVPAIGHAQHMPGHIYSIVGMWDEAAISMDAATRVEKRYMQDTLTFTFDNWNYGHNRSYLCYIQEQLGLPSAAIAGAREMIDAPLDPERNSDHLYSTQSAGIRALTRVLLNYQRWDEVLKAGAIPWRDIPEDRINKAYAETRAWLGKGDLAAARKAFAAHAKLTKDGESSDLKWIYDIQVLELKARLALAQGDQLQGLSLLADAAEKEFQSQREYADPPLYPESLYCALGEAYLAARSPLLAAQAFEKALELTHQDWFALAGLVRARVGLAEWDQATAAMARLQFVTRNAEKNLRPLELALAMGVTAPPHDAVPSPQRDYLKTLLTGYGPGQWEPYAAPTLDVLDAAGKSVTLADYTGRNVILVFYLGDECSHCMEQLVELGKKQTTWSDLDTVVLAVSSKTPAANAGALRSVGKLPVTLLSDAADHANARRFRAYDDFEDLELHATLLIDKKGRVYWGRFGGDPFTDFAFLEKQLKRMNRLTAPPSDAEARTSSSGEIDGTAKQKS